MKSTGLFIRMSEDQKLAITKIAKELGFNTSEWVRNVAINPLQALGRIDRKGSLIQDIHPSQDLTRIERGLSEIEKKEIENNSK